MLELSDAEVRLLEAFSLYVSEGQLDEPVSVGQLVSQTGLSPQEFSRAIKRLLKRNWIAPGFPQPWSEEDGLGLQGEGLARAAAMSARGELTLFEVKVADVCFYISYEEAERRRGARNWIARAHRADEPGSAPDATASGITREAARDALVRKLEVLLGQPPAPIVPCDVP